MFCQTKKIMNKRKYLDLDNQDNQDLRNSNKIHKIENSEFDYTIIPTILWDLIISFLPLSGIYYGIYRFVCKAWRDSLKFNPKLMSLASNELVLLGDLNCAQFTIDFGCKLYMSVPMFLSLKEQIPMEIIGQFLHRNHHSIEGFNEGIAQIAAGFDNLEMLHWSLSLECILNQSVAAIAAFYGHYDFLLELRKLKCPEDTWIYLLATMNDHIDFLLKLGFDSLDEYFEKPVPFSSRKQKHEQTTTVLFQHPKFKIIPLLENYKQQHDNLLFWLRFKNFLNNLSGIPKINNCEDKLIENVFRFCFDTNILNYHGHPFLLWAMAAISGDLKIFEIIYQYQTIFELNSDAFQAVVFFHNNKKELIDWMVQKKCPIEKINLFNLSALCGEFDMMKEIYQNSENPVDEIFSDSVSAIHMAAAGNHFEIIKWLYHVNPEWQDIFVLTSLVINNRLDILQWLYDQKIPFYNPNKMYKAATKHRNLEIIKWAFERNFALPCNVMGKASQRGNIEILQWAHEHQCPYKKKIFQKIIEKGCLESLQWFKEHDYPCIYSGIDEDAAYHGHLHILEWLKANNYSFGESNVLYSSAVRAKKITILDWLKNNGFTLHVSIYREAIYYGLLNVLEWAFSNDCPYDDNLFSYLNYGTKIEILEWLKQHQFVWTSDAYIKAINCDNFQAFMWFFMNGYPLSETIFQMVHQRWKLKKLMKKQMMNQISIFQITQNNT